jgi:hypothetical protein
MNYFISSRQRDYPTVMIGSTKVRIKVGLEWGIGIRTGLL